MPEDEQRKAIRAYYASISFMDAQVGRLLEALDRLGLTDKTVIVFLSDHGYHLGDHGGVWMKQTLFERSTRTPVIFAGPGVTAGGSSRRIVEMVDLYPTLAAIAGVTPPSGLEGRSLSPLLATPDAAWDHAAMSQVRRPLNGVGRRGAGRGAAGRGQGVGRAAAAGPDVGYTVRTELYRYIQWNDGDAGEELFDELNDPGEVRNLAASPFYASVLTEMKQKLRDMRAPKAN